MRGVSRPSRLRSHAAGNGLRAGCCRAINRTYESHPSRPPLRACSRPLGRGGGADQPAEYPQIRPRVVLGPRFHRQAQGDRQLPSVAAQWHELPRHEVHRCIIRAMRFGRCEYEGRGFWSGDEVLPLHLEWGGPRGRELCRGSHRVGEFPRGGFARVEKSGRCQKGECPARRPAGRRSFENEATDGRSGMG